MTVAVIGAGPAGLSAVVWLRKYGVDTAWYDADGRVGGMLWDVHNAIEDYPGMHAANGAAFADALAHSISEEPAPRAVSRIVKNHEGFSLQLGDATQKMTAVILATGTRKRRLGVPGELEGLGRWVRQSAARDAGGFGGKRVAIVGGGDSAVEGALLLADNGAEEVVLVSRSPLRARACFKSRLEGLPNVRRLPVGREVVAIEPIDSGCRLSLDDGLELEVAALFVRIGVEPVVPELKPDPRRDGAGFVVVDREGRTSVTGLFAAGDVTDGPLRSIASGVAGGAVAARAAAEYLETL